MKKISLITALFIGVILLQNCKKDTVNASTYSTQLFFANINDSSWSPTVATSNINYSAANKTKTFSCVASTPNQKVSFYVKLKNASNASGFPLNTYSVDSTTNVGMSYYAFQNNVLSPVGTVTPGSGSITISAIDSVNKVITGTFGFTTVKNNYDSSGNFLSVSVSRVSAGAFNKLPYTVTSTDL